MPLVPFGEYKPDLSDYEASSERNVQNVVPRGDGYGPFPSLAAISASLGGQCRGAFEAVKTDGSVVIFAATSTNLFLFNNTTFAWTNVSLGGGPYTALSPTDLWQFRQFNSLVFATQCNVVLQVVDISNPITAFSNALGSPPQARYIDIVGKFLVLTGLLLNPNRVQWSGLNDVNSANSWTSGLNSSDLQDLVDGGFTRGLAGGETGVIFQDTIIRRMIYLPGDPRVFQIEKISDGLGLYAPYSVVRADSAVYFYSIRGFHKIEPGGVPMPIGHERIDRTVFLDLDTNNLQLFQGVTDPRSGRIVWPYKSVNGISNQFDKLLCYDALLDRFTLIKVSGEFIFTLSQPGTTLEGVDFVAPGELAITGAANNGSGLIRIAVADTSSLASRPYISIQSVTGTTEANGNWFITVIDATHFDLQGSTFVRAYVSGGIVGGNIDLMTTQSLDSFSTAIVPELGAFDASHVMNFFRGPSLEATLETAEQGTDGQRIKLKKGFRPITDAPIVYGSASARENLGLPVNAGAEILVNSTTGICNLLLDTRYSRFKARIPAGTVWTFINGVEPLDLAATGKR